MKRLILLSAIVLSSLGLNAQDYEGIYLYKKAALNTADSLSSSTVQYIKFTFLNQVWLRYADYNTGSTIFGNEVDKRFDIGLRRTRMQVFGEVFKNTFFYMQMGINNFSTTGSRKPGIFFHDALIEYKIKPEVLHLGAGLTGWNGLSRYSSPSIGSILTIDAPLFAQTTNDVSDQFLRKLSMYAKGTISKLNYRLIATSPMSIEQSGKSQPLSTTSYFADEVPSLQTAGYAFWQFLDKEKSTTPYTKGTYLGKKKVFNIGAGFQYQPDAMWHMNADNDTVRTAMNNVAMDVFLELPIDSAKKGTVTAFFSHYWLDFGPYYYRNIGAMNPANGNNDPTIINGGGTAAPVLGTGRIYYSQLAYLLPKSLTGERLQVQPYMSLTHANYDYLSEIFWMYDAGVNLYLDGHRNKVTFNYQSRPVFGTDSDFQNVVKERKGMYLIQLQISI